MALLFLSIGSRHPAVWNATCIVVRDIDHTANLNRVLAYVFYHSRKESDAKFTSHCVARLRSGPGRTGWSVDSVAISRRGSLLPSDAGTTTLSTVLSASASTGSSGNVRSSFGVLSEQFIRTWCIGTVRCPCPCCGTPLHGTIQSIELRAVSRRSQSAGQVLERIPRQCGVPRARNSLSLTQVSMRHLSATRTKVAGSWLVRR